MTDDVKKRLEHLTEALMSSPKAAFNDWPYWIGFGVLEYVGGFIQENIRAVDNGYSVGMQRFLGAVTRGGILTLNLSYWEEGHS